MATVLILLRLFSVFVHYNILFYFSKFSFLFYDKKRPISNCKYCEKKTTTTTTTTLQQIIFNTFLFKKQKMVMCYVWQHKIAVVSNIVYYSKT